MKLVKTCTSQHGPCVNSPYPKNSVPLDLFKENPEDPKSKIFKNCLHCRNYNKESHKKKKEKFNKNRSEKNMEEYGYCIDPRHNTYSKFPRDNVPIDLFRRVKGNPKSEIYKTCFDCRECKKEENKKHKTNKLLNAEKEGKKICSRCYKEINDESKQYDENGKELLRCNECNLYSRKYRENLSNIRKKIIHEMFEKYDCCCMKCKRVFFKPGDGENILKCVETYIKEDGVRYLIYNDSEISFKDLIIKYSEYIEFSVIELDHLPEDEQRKRGLLSSDEEFIPKIDVVSNMDSEHNMRLEALKCQHLCSRCHSEETKIRETKNSKVFGLRKSKMDYVNNIKLEGCSNCSYKDPDLLRFFEMDHLDRSTKIKEVSTMVYDIKYTLEQLIKECEKCRVLCKFCHKIHTKKQLNINN